MAPDPHPRTYNQVHVPRKYAAGKRRVSVYWSWSYPWEANRDVTEMDNRFSTMTEVRRVAWPTYESIEYSAEDVPAGHRRNARALPPLPRPLPAARRARSRDIPSPSTSASTRRARRLPIDERVLDDTDTLMVFGLDHMVDRAGGQPSGDRGAPAISRRGKGRCLILGPHHDVGASTDLKVRAMEYAHHGDPLVPAPAALRHDTRARS